MNHVQTSRSNLFIPVGLGILLLVTGCISGDSKLPVEIIKKLYPDERFMELSQDVWQPIKDKSEAAFYYMVGEHKLVSQNLEKANAHYVSAYNLDPNPFLAERVLYTDIANKDINQSLKLGKKLTLLFPRSIQLKSTYASYLLLAKENQLAMQQLVKSVALDPYHEESYALLVQLYQTTANLKKIKETAVQWMKRLPRSAAPYNLLARIALSERKARTALSYAKSAYQLMPRSIDNLLLYALSLDLNKKSAESILLYEELFKIVPDNVQLVQHMSSLYENLGEGMNAISVLDQFIASKGRENTSRLLLHKAILLWKYGLKDESSIILIELFEKNPSDTTIQYFSGFALEHIGQPEKALSIYGELRNTKSFELASLFRSAEILKSNGRLEEALNLVRSYLKSNRQKPRVWSFLSSLYEESKNYSDALEAIKEVLSIEPANPDFLFLSGAYLERLGESEESIKIMRQIISLDKNYSAAYNFIGYLYLEKNRSLEEAKDLIKKALRIKPQDPYYLDSLGWYFYLVKDYDSSEKYLLMAHKILPEDDEVNGHLVQLYVVKKDASRAQKYLDLLRGSKSFDPDKLQQLEDKVLKIPPL